MRGAAKQYKKIKAAETLICTRYAVYLEKTGEYIMKDPYIILGLPRSAGAEMLAARYEMLKARYAEERFLPGEQGNNAALRLSELEEAWELILVDINSDRRSEEFGGEYGYIDELIKKGNFDEAQKLLDADTNRTAEWHYLQSIIFYRREWIADSRTQLEMAVNMEPHNQKYRQALDRLILMAGNPNVNPGNYGMPPGYQPPPAAQEQQANTCAHCCMAYLCTDCLCNLMRCC